MQASVRHQIEIFAVGIIVFFSNLGVTRLWDQDEAYFARTAVEMHERNEWVVPYFNGEPFAHKPPLMFWMMRVGFSMFGVNELGARFWSGVFGIATALLTYRLGRKVFNANVGLLAGQAMCTTVMFDIVGRAATPDSYLVFFCTLALYLFARREKWDEPAAESGREDVLKNISWSQWIAIYAVMGVAVLTKGPIGVVLPGCVIGLYLLMRDSVGKLPLDATWGDRVLLFLRRFTRFFVVLWQMRPFTAIATILLVAGPWYVLVDWRTEGNFLAEFFGVHHFGRFFNAMDQHSGPIWYYIPAVLVGFFPWSIFGIPTVLNLMRGCREIDKSRTPTNLAARFTACWIIVFVGFVSLAQTKLPSYALPAYPALALATAAFIHRWLTQPASVNRWWPRLSFGSLVLVGLIMAIGGPVVAHLLEAGTLIKGRPIAAPELSGEVLLLAGLGAILLIGGGICLALSELRRSEATVAGLALTAVLFCTSLFAGIAVRVDRHQPSPMVAEVIRHHTHQSPRVAQFAYFRPSLVYYTGTKVEACKNPEEVSKFLKSSPDAFLVTTEEHYKKLYSTLPVEAVVLDRRPEFPEKGTVVVIGTKAAVAGRIFTTQGK